MKELISKTKYNQPKVIPLLTIQCLKNIYVVVWSVWISEELESLLNNKVVKNIAFHNVFFFIPVCNDESSSSSELWCY